MTSPRSPHAAARRTFLACALGAAASLASGQAAPAASASTSQMVKDAAVLLTPFTVSTDQDRGYAAGNTLSGGRVDTPLALSSASISVMTRQFLDDFDITDLNQAAA